MKNTPVQFDDETIHAIFGHEAAENEPIDRLREYYFKSQVFERVTASLPLRILVGHKGTGKSALFSVAKAEDREHGVLSLLIRPDDVQEVTTGTGDILSDIRNWKTGLLRILYSKALDALNVTDTASYEQRIRTLGRVANFITDLLKPVVEQYIDLDGTRRAATQKLLSKQQVNVYLDDLDRGWSGNAAGISRLSALLNALRDLSTEHAGLNFRVAMRSDVYFLVRTADESTDKIEGSVVWHTWTNHEILAMMVKRVEAFFGRYPDEQRLMKMRQPDLASYLEPVVEPQFRGEGNWQNIPTYRMLMSLVRKRPRDIVKLCTLAAQSAREKKCPRIGTGEFASIFEQYSQGRLQDTVNEFRSELPEIERLLLNMKPNRKQKQTRLNYVYTTEELLKKIRCIEEQGAFRFSGNRPCNTKALAHFMYKINFLTARKVHDDGEIVRKYFEENKYLSSTVTEFGFDWEVHPAYRWALQPDDPRSLFTEFEFSRSD